MRQQKFRRLPLTLAMLAASLAYAGEPPIPAAAFFGPARVGAAKISPDGTRVAMLVNNEAGRDQLGIVNLADGALKVIASFSDADVGRFDWVNDGRLLYDTHDGHTAQGAMRYAGGLSAVNADGSGRVDLARVSDGPPAPNARNKLPVNTFMLDQAGAQDSDWVYVGSYQFNPDTSIKQVDLTRVNTVSGAAQVVDGPAHARRWWLDAAGRPALALTVANRIETLHYLDPGTGRWRPLGSRAYLGYARDAAPAPPQQADNAGAMAVVTVGRDDVLRFMPLAFAPEGTLYVTSHSKRDTDALFRYELATGKLAERPLVDTGPYDFSGTLITGTAGLLGVRYGTDTQHTAWFAPAMAQAQQAVDKLLPGRVNALSVGVHAATPFMLVTSSSDRQPPVYMLFNRATGSLSKLAESRPAIAPGKMAAQSLVLITARDGRQVPAWVTVPAGAAGKQAPMVVLVHGGPQVRAREWGWHDESQFLAARGYVVLEPAFRGGTGYGQAYFRAGWKQWGLAMQDDIADATRWAIGQGMADPARICIAGGGYGGYAALMGLVRDPALYRCGVDWAGVTDIGQLFAQDWAGDRELPGDWRALGMSKLLGDPAGDAAQWAAASPLQQAARITQPLLLAYGDDDRRVPISQGRAFHDALSRTNPHVEWLVYKNEGNGGGLAYGDDDRPAWLFQQNSKPGPIDSPEGPLGQIDDDIAWIVFDKEARGWSLTSNQVDFWNRVALFLQRHIGQ